MTMGPWFIGTVEANVEMEIDAGVGRGRCG